MRAKFNLEITSPRQLADILTFHGIDLPAELGVSAAAVGNWKTLGSFPPRIYLRMAEICRRAGLGTPPTRFFRRMLPPTPEDQDAA